MEISMRKRKFRQLLGVIAILCGVFLLSPPAQAGDKYWVGGNGWWNEGSNWNPYGQPQDGNTVYLTSYDSTDRTVFYYNALYPTAVLDFLGIDATGTGTMTLNQGYAYSLSTSVEFIGYSGMGSYVQSLGTNTITNSLYLGSNSGSSGSYKLSGGTLSVGTHEYIGIGSTSKFTQSGGTNTVAKYLCLGYYAGGSGTYSLSSTGRLSADEETIGRNGIGKFTQSEGTNTVRNALVIGAFNIGTYDLSGGSLSTHHIDIGWKSNGTFTQSEGTNTVSSHLYLGLWSGGNGTYTISGGSLSVPDFYVGMGGNGTLNIDNATADISVSNKLRFGPDSTFTAVPGTTIHMTGSAFENANTDANDLAGLSNLELIFEGGNADTDPFEVAGQDLGAVMAGFDNNFALGTLTLGRIDIGKIQLVDNFDNQSGWQGSEALYIYNLNIGAGSYLDLNGLNLYYLSGTIDPGATILGGTLTPIPEPASLALFLLGLGSLKIHRRRRKK